MAKTNKTQYALMGMLSLRPMSGYDVKKTIQRSVGYFWSESFGQIYPILRQLVADGLATPERARQAGKRDRIVYRLTAAGSTELRRWLAVPADPEIVRSEILLKLFFGWQVSVADNRKHVELEREKALGALRALQGIATVLAARGTGDLRSSYMHMTVEYGRHAAQATVDWCDETLEILPKLARTEKKRRRSLRRPNPPARRAREARAR